VRGGVSTSPSLAFAQADEPGAHRGAGPRSQVGGDSGASLSVEGFSGWPCRCIAEGVALPVPCGVLQEMEAALGAARAKVAAADAGLAAVERAHQVREGERASCSHRTERGSPRHDCQAMVELERSVGEGRREVAGRGEEDHQRLDTAVQDLRQQVDEIEVSRGRGWHCLTAA
jgi:hypothetical protein